MTADPVDLSPRIPHQILTSLLNKPRYRAKWMPYVQRRRGNAINQRAVAAFIAGELSDEIGQEISPQKLKDRVARALKGEAISDATAKLFTSTFDFTPQEADELQRALSTHRMALKVAHRSAGFRDHEAQPSSDRQYTSLSTLFEGRINEYGYFYEATVTEMIQAEAEVIESLIPRFESASLKCTLLEGGELIDIDTTASDIKPHVEGNSIHKLVIKPPHPIRKGEIHQVRYKLELDMYNLLQDDDSETSIAFGPFSPPRFNFSFSLQFEASPTGLREKFWSKALKDSNLIETHDLPPKDTHSVHFPLIEETIYGCFWDCKVDEARAHFGVDLTP